MELTVVGLVQEIKESKISISNILREPIAYRVLLSCSRSKKVF